MLLFGKLNQLLKLKQGFNTFGITLLKFHLHTKEIREMTLTEIKLVSHEIIF